MPTSLFQYEMLPTTWFYLSSLLILAAFFRFNRVLSIRNFDVALFVATTPGLIYIAMGSSEQGYRYLWFVDFLLFLRLLLDPCLLRRPLLEPNLNHTGLAFSCVAASAFIVPNLLLNRGDACESPRGWRLEQILAAAEDTNPEKSNLENWPGYPPFLRMTQETDRFFAPSRESWKRAVDEMNDLAPRSDGFDFFGTTLTLKEESRARRPLARVIRRASGASYESSFETDAEVARDDFDELRAAPSIPVASSAPFAQDVGDDEARRSAQKTANDDERSNLKTHANDLREARASSASGVTRSNEFRWQSLSREGLLLILFVCALQLGIVVLLVMIGRANFGSLQTGLAAALIYLLLPYVNQFSARLDHVVPAFAILLAVAFYRRPFVSGAALGVAGSLVFYPLFLIPLWLGFYWKKGAVRFAFGASAAILTFATLLLFLIDSDVGYASALASTFGRHSLFLACADGIWEYWPRYFRIPLIALYFVFTVAFALWTPRRSLATLLAYSAALMLAVQFWQGRQGGLYMAWYLPLSVLTVFRPNLDDRTAQNVVVDVDARF